MCERTLTNFVRWCWIVIIGNMHFARGSSFLQCWHTIAARRLWPTPVSSLKWTWGTTRCISAELTPQRTQPLQRKLEKKLDLNPAHLNPTTANVKRLGYLLFYFLNSWSVYRPSNIFKLPNTITNINIYLNDYTYYKQYSTYIYIGSHG